MDINTIAAVLAGLTGTTLIVGCDKAGSDATEAPAVVHDAKADEVGEHSCGVHPEGACGAEMAPDAAPAVASSRSFEVESGKFAEVNFKMTKGSTVSATFEDGSSSIAWDIHSHDHSGGTKIHDSGTGGAGTVEFTAPADGVFSILWKNGGAASTPLGVSITLGDGTVIHSWIPEE